MFRVVPDQLRISEGWVRCGQCDEVFDANAHLQSLEQPQTAVEGSHGWRPVSEQSPRSSSANTLQDATDPIVRPADGLEAPEPSIGEVPSAASPAPADDRVEPTAFADVGLPDMPASMDTPVTDYGSDPMDDWVHPTVLAAPTQGDAAAPPMDADEAPSFMPRASGQSRIGRYLGAKVMGVALLLLALVLALQYVLLERDRLAAVTPALRPMLTASCVLLGCTLSAPRQIESIAIESSTFASVNPGVYDLRLSLRNVSALDLAAPALELTLTDMQDHALVRRVLLPTEYGGTLLIAAGAELAANVPMAVREGSTAEKIAGYKLLAFYP